MTLYKLNRTNGPELSFDGELLTETRGAPDPLGRRYVVAVYRSRDGYVVEIRFWQAADAAPAIVAEFVEQPEDVDKVLYVFEPLEQLAPLSTKDLSKDERQALTNQLFKLYDKEVASALKELGLSVTSQSASHQSAAVAKPD